MAPTQLNLLRDNPFRAHIPRDGSGLSSSNNHTMMDLVIVLLCLLFAAICLAGGLLFLRARRRAARKALGELPMYAADEKRMSTASMASSKNNHRRIMVRASEAAVSVYDEKHELAKADDLDSPPDSPLPEIRITFPEEIDESSGKMRSGRVVVVHVGEAGGVGLEPADNPPAYQLTADERFHSLDLDRIGGLVEKARNSTPRKEFE